MLKWTVVERKKNISKIRSQCKEYLDHKFKIDIREFGLDFNNSTCIIIMDIFNTLLRCLSHYQRRLNLLSMEAFNLSLFPLLNITRTLNSWAWVSSTLLIHALKSFEISLTTKPRPRLYGSTNQSLCLWTLLERNFRITFVSFELNSNSLLR
jgi:hypothetical protein